MNFFSIAFIWLLYYSKTKQNLFIFPPSSSKPFSSLSTLPKTLRLSPSFLLQSIPKCGQRREEICEKSLMPPHYHHKLRQSREFGEQKPKTFVDMPPIVSSILDLFTSYSEMGLLDFANYAFNFLNLTLNYTCFDFQVKDPTCLP